MDELRSRPNPRRSARPFFRSLACPRLSARSRGCRRSETDCFARKCAKAWFELEAARTPPIHGRRARLGGEADSQPVRDLLRARRVRGAGPDVLGGGSCCASGAFPYLCMLVRPCAAWEPAAPAHGVVVVVGGGVAVPARPQGGAVALEEGHALRPTSGCEGFWGCRCRVWGSGTLFNIRDAALEEGHADEALKSPRRVGYRAGSRAAHCARGAPSSPCGGRQRYCESGATRGGGREGRTDGGREGGREGGRTRRAHAYCIEKEREKEGGRGERQR